MLGKGGAFAKVDYMNAFNRAFGKAIAEAVPKHCSELAPCAEAACGPSPHPSCGAEPMPSEMGVRQGDPLGPALFSLAAPACVNLPKEPT